MRVDIEEGSKYPRKFITWGNIIPYSNLAPVRKYILICLPIFKHGNYCLYAEDKTIFCKLQLCLRYTKTVGMPNISFDGWHAAWLPKE
jgi:hypothetical protein